MSPVARRLLAVHAVTGGRSGLWMYMLLDRTLQGVIQMEKVVLFAFNGELMCFVHVLLNALDMKEKGFEIKIVIEGAATGVIPEIARKGNPMHGLYSRAREKGLIDGACKACSNKMGVLKAIESEGIPLLGKMSGHPGMAEYIKQGYRVITF